MKRKATDAPCGYSVLPYTRNDWREASEIFVPSYILPTLSHWSVHLERQVFNQACHFLVYLI